MKTLPKYLPHRQSRLFTCSYLQLKTHPSPTMAMVDSRGPGGYQFPQRKPVGSQLSTSINGPQQRSQTFSELDFTPSGRQSTFTQNSGTVRKPTPSSTAPVSPPYYNPTMSTTRRTPSNATSSTTGSTAVPTRTPSNVSSNLSRTSSSRSGGSLSPSSYVALMRKQKATVWCDRAQHEDPRILAQQKAAKMRAQREVSGGKESRTSTGSIGSGSIGVRRKIIHHNIPKTTGYNYPNMVAGGVPMRLISSEVGDEASVLDDGEGTMHQRTNSGMSNRWLGTASDRRQSYRYSQGSLRTSGQGASPSEDIPELEETPVPSHYSHTDRVEVEGDYFSQHPADLEGGSGSSSSELESNFGSVGQMKAPVTSRDVGKSRIDDLRRRGSVDERSNTMGGGRLYVTNPDLSD